MNLDSNMEQPYPPKKTRFLQARYELISYNKGNIKRNGNTPGKYIPITFKPRELIFICYSQPRNAVFLIIVQ